MANGSHYFFVQDGYQVQRMTLTESVPVTTNRTMNNEMTEIIPIYKLEYFLPIYTVQTGVFSSNLHSADWTILIALHALNTLQL